MKNLFIEYGNAETTIVYIVNADTREDVIAMPVLFTENRFAMGWEASALAKKKLH